MSTYQIDAPIGAGYDGSGFIASPQARAFSASQSAQRLVEPVVRLFVLALAAYRTRRAEREMQQLDERMLRDIGISRETIKHAVRYGRGCDAAPFASAWTSWGVNDPFHH